MYDETFTNAEVLVVYEFCSLYISDYLTESQYPVFTLYAHKICVRDSRNLCFDKSGWLFDLVPETALDGTKAREIQIFDSREECMEACIKMDKFICRSATYTPNRRECAMSEMDRHSLQGQDSFLVS